MTQENTSMPTNLQEAQEYINGNEESLSDIVGGQVDGNYFTGDMTASEDLPENNGKTNIDLSDLNRDNIESLFSENDTSQTNVKPEEGRAEDTVREETTEQSEETSEGVTPAEGSNDAQESEADAEESSEESDKEPEKLIYDLKELEEQNFNISMKVDGEFKEFDMKTIQKLVGQQSVAEEKSRRAAEDRKQADEAMNILRSQQEQSQSHNQILSANQELAGMASEIIAKKQAREKARQDGDKYTAGELTDEIDTLTNNYQTAYNGAIKLVKQAETKHLTNQREILNKSDIGKKFNSDVEFRKSVGKHLEGKGVNPQALKAISMDADLMKIVIEHYNMSNSVKPVKRKPLPVTKNIRSASSAPKQTKPVGKKGSIQDRLSKGNMTLSDLTDNRGLLNDF